MACPHLSYRRESDDQSFDRERAYCTVAGRFVQPMRADICTERYGLDPVSDCEIYRADAGLAWDESGEQAGHAETNTDDSAGTPTESVTDTDESNPDGSDDRSTGTTDSDAEEE